MPSIVTHYSFAKDVYKKLDLKTQERVDKETMEIFAQSFDYFFYYNFLSFKKGKAIRDLAKTTHRSNTQLYFINIVKYILKNNLQENKEVLGYLYGSLTHYTLDTICHPFVFFKTGVYYKNMSATAKYRGMHTKMEKNIDAYYSKVQFKKPLYKLKIVKEVIPRHTFSKEVLSTISWVYKETYNKENIGVYVNKAYKNTRNLYRFLIQDKSGIKRKLYSFIDFFNKKGMVFKNYSFHIVAEDLKFLNLDKKYWCHPCDDSIISDASFLDLYEDALNKTLKIIEEINKVLYEKQNIKSLVDVIENVSYITGLPIEKNKRLQFFEY